MEVEMEPLWRHLSADGHSKLRCFLILFLAYFKSLYKYKKNFWYSRDPYRANKLEYFLCKLNLKKRVINENQDFNKEIDYISFEDKLKNWKRFSKEFLIKSINSLNN